MNKTLKMLLLTLLLLSTTLTAKTQAILKLDTLGHTGMITDIVVTKSGDIISASVDKTIRVWSSQTGREKRKILGQIGSGSEGMIYAIALTPDERYLAVGGFILGTGNDGSRAGTIRIYNYQTGKLLQLLKSHTNVVKDLAFSKDGRFLISGSADTTAKIWSVEKDFQLQDTIKFHTNDVYGVKIIQKDGRYFALTAGDDNKIALYDMQKRRVIKSDSSNYKLRYLATNSSLQQIAVCGMGKEIDIYDFNLNLLKRIKSETVPSGLHYSRDGRFLIAGTGGYPYNVNIYKTSQNYALYRTFKKHTNLTMAVNFIERGDRTVAVSGGGTNYEIYIWDFSHKTPKVLRKIVGVGQSVLSVGIQGDSVAWGNVWTKPNRQSKLQKSINLKTFSIQNSKLNIQNFHRISIRNGAFSLSHSRGGDYGLADAILNIKENGRLKAKIVKTVIDGFRHSCYGWYKDYIVSGGGSGQLKIYNKQGREIASLVGHTGMIWSIAVDGDRLVSGSSDQTIKVWDLSKLKIDNGEWRIDKKYVKDIMKATKWTYNQVIENANSIEKVMYRSIYLKPLDEDTIKIFMEASKISKEEAKDFILNNAELIVKHFYLPLYKEPKSQKIYPTLNIFVSKNNEYVAWTKEGFFTASKGGAKYIGYHLNQGANKEARFVSVDKLYNTFYRPDLVQKALHGEDLSRYAKDINIDKILGSGLAPKVAILNKVTTSKKRDMNLKLQVCTIDNGGYNNLTLYLNGMAIDVIGQDRALKLKKRNRTRKDCFTMDKLISLTNGKNVIGFKATNRVGNIESNLDEIVVNYKGRSTKRPNLYILSIGIDKYRDGDLWLKYSKADAVAFVKAIKKASKPLFRHIYTYELLDRDVTKANILKTFKKIGAKTSREDVFIFYMAGHGITDAKTGAYFYLPVDFRYKNENSVRKNGMSQNDFKLALSKIQAMKSLTILDTCNSGSFAEAMASRGILQKTAINKLTRATGRATIVASSKDQVALEGYKGHGVFTYTLIEALRGKGYGTDNKITIKELDAYIEDVLPDRTYKKWGYEQIPQSYISGNDFPIGVR